MAAKKLQGQVAIITGASRGIGRAAAQRLALAGAAVVLVARDEEVLVRAREEIVAQDGRAIAVAADVADLEQIEAVIEATLDEFQRIDILINNAAIVWPLEELAEVDLDEWAYSIHVNLIGPFYMTRTVLPVMQAQKYGRIINVTSAAAKYPIAGASAYGTAKAGLDALTQTLALELEGEPIIVAGFDPGGVDTDMQADVRSIDTDESTLDFRGFHEAHATGKLASPEQIAPLLLWLAGPWNRVSGHIFRASDPDFIAQVQSDL